MSRELQGRESCFRRKHLSPTDLWRVSFRVDPSLFFSMRKHLPFPDVFPQLKVLTFMVVSVSSCQVTSRPECPFSVSHAGWFWKFGPVSFDVGKGRAHHTSPFLRPLGVWERISTSDWPQSGGGTEIRADPQWLSTPWIYITATTFVNSVPAGQPSGLQVFPQLG